MRNSKNSVRILGGRSTVKFQLVEYFFVKFQVGRIFFYIDRPCDQPWLNLEYASTTSFLRDAQILNGTIVQV